MTEAGFQSIVQASRYYTVEDDGLAQDWHAETVLLNPAGGLVVPAWEKLTTHWHYGHIQRAVWIGYSVEQLALLADYSPHPLDFSWCVLRKRVAFTRHDGYRGSPSHSNYVAALSVPHELFLQQFGDLGRCGAGSKAVR